MTVNYFLNMEIIMPELIDESLKEILKNDDINEIADYLEKNIGLLFSTPFIPDNYKLIREADIDASPSVTAKLIYAWLAFTSGDHANMFRVFNNITELQLDNPRCSSLYYGLKAFISSMLNIEDGLKYAKLSIDILPEDDQSIYMANSYLTYGQILSSDDQYREASIMFNHSANIFKSLNLHFLFITSKTNELLNLYKLGEYANVFNQANEILLTSESFMNDTASYYNLINLPLGMCYYELNKHALAIKHLLLAKEFIDNAKLFHMHGLIELYLFKSYYILKDKKHLLELANQVSDMFDKMHYPQIKLLIAFFNIYCHEIYEKDIKPDIELFELEFINGKLGSYSVIIEGLVYLKLKELSYIIKPSDLVTYLEKYKYIGNISYVQLTLIQLTELCLLDNMKKEALEYLKEAIKIYKDYGISANFYLLPLKSLSLIKKLDNTLYTALSEETSPKESDNLLTDREKEIIELISLGKSNEEISQDLFISVGTIKWHINHIFSKLDVKNRIQAVEKAKRMKIL